MTILNRIPLISTVLIALGMPLFGNATGAIGPIKGKAFAVFVASYNTYNNEVRGGVAGTAFFVTPSRAITAYHVLQASSFKPLKGFERVRVWLVHENHPAILLDSSDLRFDADHDVTKISLDHTRKVPSQFLFALDRLAPISNFVETEGFPANSVGPILERQGDNLEVVSVPRLERLKLSGQILKHSDVSLHTDDFHIKSAPCLQLSYQPIIGFSGGPVVSNGRVIGVNSFADPDSRRQTWAQQVSVSLFN